MCRRCSEHADFSESTEEIAPLTEEEKKARLEELRQKVKEKKASQAMVDKEEQKRNEVGSDPMLYRVMLYCVTSSHPCRPQIPTINSNTATTTVTTTLAVTT